MKRNKLEGNLISSLIKKYNIDISTIYDVACGDGYPAILFQNKEMKNYIGYDFSSSAIEVCKNNFVKDPRYLFIRKDISDINIEDFINANLIVSVSLVQYINYDNIEGLLQIFSILPNVYLYFRTTASMTSERITLDNFYSEELEINYSAIYRTKQEYLDIFKKYNFDIIETDIIKNVKEREETKLIYYLLTTK